MTRVSMWSSYEPLERLNTWPQSNATECGETSGLDRPTGSAASPIPWSRMPPFQEEHPMGPCLRNWSQENASPFPAGGRRCLGSKWAALGPHEVRIRDTRDDAPLTPLSDDMLIAASQDTIVTFQFDTDNSEEVDVIQQLSPTMRGYPPVICGQFALLSRSIGRPVADMRHSPENAGLNSLPSQGRTMGRSEICDELWKTLRETHTQAAPRAVILKGPSGVGKSRIAEWLCERAHEVGAATVLRAHHDRNRAWLMALSPCLRVT